MNSLIKGEIAEESDLWKYLDKAMVNWRCTFRRHLKMCGQFDCSLVAYPLHEKEDIDNTAHVHLGFVQSGVHRLVIYLP